MRDGLRFSVALNEFVVAAVCVTVIACTVGYLYTHRTQPTVVVQAPAPAPCPPPSAAPTITIEQTIFIPVPASRAKGMHEYFGENDGDNAPDTFTPDPNLDHPPTPQDDNGTTLDDQSRSVIISFEHPPSLSPRSGFTMPDSLHQPMPR